MKIKIKIKKKILSYKPGQVVTVDADGSGNPFDRFWRNRLRDCKVDDCIEILKEEVPVIKKHSTKEIAQDANITT